MIFQDPFTIFAFNYLEIRLVAISTPANANFSAIWTWTPESDNTKNISQK